MRLGDAGFVHRFADAARLGTYLAIEAAGDVGAGDPIEIVHRPDHDVTIGMVERASTTGTTSACERLVWTRTLSEAQGAWRRAQAYR